MTDEKREALMITMQRVINAAPVEILCHNICKKISLQGQSDELNCHRELLALACINYIEVEKANLEQREEVDKPSIIHG